MSMAALRVFVCWGGRLPGILPRTRVAKLCPLLSHAGPATCRPPKSPLPDCLSALALPSSLAVPAASSCHWRARLAPLLVCFNPACSIPLFPGPSPGDGAGILVAMPHLFMSEVAQRECGIELPPQVQPGRGGRGRGGEPRVTWCEKVVCPTPMRSVHKALLGARNFHAWTELVIRAGGHNFAPPGPCLPRLPANRAACAACLPACRATMPWAWCSCPRTRPSTRQPRRRCTRWRPTRGTRCWAGAACPPTTGAARPPARCRPCWPPCLACARTGRPATRPKPCRLHHPLLSTAAAGTSRNECHVIADQAARPPPPPPPLACSTLGASAVKTEPVVEQFFVLRATSEEAQKLPLERQVCACLCVCVRACVVHARAGVRVWCVCVRRGGGLGRAPCQPGRRCSGGPGREVGGAPTHPARYPTPTLTRADVRAAQAD